MTTRRSLYCTFGTFVVFEVIFVTQATLTIAELNRTVIIIVMVVVMVFMYVLGM